MKKPKRVKKDEYDGKSPKVWSQFEDEGYGDKVMGKDSKKWDISQSLTQIWTKTWMMSKEINPIQTSWR